MQVRFSPCGHAVCCRRCAAEACCASLTLTLALALSYPIPLPTLTLTLTLTSLAARRRPPQAAARAAAPSARVASRAGSRRTCSSSRRGCSSGALVGPHRSTPHSRRRTQLTCLARRQRQRLQRPRRRLAVAVGAAAGAADGACDALIPIAEQGRGSRGAGATSMKYVPSITRGRRQACPCAYVRLLCCFAYTAL